MVGWGLQEWEVEWFPVQKYKIKIFDLITNTFTRTHGYNNNNLKWRSYLHHCIYAQSGKLIKASPQNKTKERKKKKIFQILLYSGSINVIWFILITLFYIYQITENSFDKLVADFQLALYHHHEENKTPLYNPVLMRDFAKENAPGLFDTILNSILRDDERLSKESRSLQEQLTVVLLLTLAYFR